jgi:hypothetical protein
VYTDVNERNQTQSAQVRKEAEGRRKKKEERRKKKEGSAKRQRQTGSFDLEPVACLRCYYRKRIAAVN